MNKPAVTPNGMEEGTKCCIETCGIGGIPGIPPAAIIIPGGIGIPGRGIFAGGGPDGSSGGNCGSPLKI